MIAEQTKEFGISIARRIVECRESEWPTVFHELRRQGQLSNAIHEINNLQDDPAYCDLATAAIQRMGFH